MTITLELKADTEAAAKAAAQAEGVAVEEYLGSFLEGHLLGRKQAMTSEEQREAALSRIRSGFYASRLLPSEEFSARKEEEKALEERHWKHK